MDVAVDQDDAVELEARPATPTVETSTTAVRLIGTGYFHIGYRVDANDVSWVVRDRKLDARQTLGRWEPVWPAWKPGAERVTPIAARIVDEEWLQLLVPNGVLQFHPNASEVRTFADWGSVPTVAGAGWLADPSTFGAVVPSGK